MNKNYHRLFVVFSLLLAFVPRMFSQSQMIGTTFLDFAIRPEISFPLDFVTGGVSYGAQAEACLNLPGSPAEAFLEGGAAFMPLNLNARMDTYRVGAGVGLRLNPIPRLAVQLRLSAGWMHGIFGKNDFMAEDLVGEFAWATLRARAGFFFSPGISAGVEASYRYDFGLAGALSLSPFVAFHVSDGKRLVPLAIETEPLFPSLAGYYAAHPIGMARFRNRERFPLENVTLTLKSASFAERPVSLSADSVILPGNTLEADFGILFSDAARLSNQGGSVRGDLLVSYAAGGKQFEETFPVQLRLNENNAIVWDDDRKAASFITEKDPAVRAFAGAASSAVRKSEARFPSNAIRVACTLFTALQEYGTAYVLAPVAAYSVAVKQNHIVDFIKYPAQTLAYRAGDCSDLTALYCALLESAGVEAGFITVPGHIYSAFSTGLSASVAKRFLATAESLIIIDGVAWMPIETTLAVKGFDAAREAGATQWKKWEAEGKAVLYSVRESWKEYPPSDMPGMAQGAGVAAEAAVASAFETESGLFAKRDLIPLVDALTKAMNPKDAKTGNTLGILFCQYGKLEDGERQFRASLAIAANVPAAVNLANIYFIRGDYASALKYFKSALALDQNNQSALAGAIRSLVALGDAKNIGQYLSRLEAQNPGMAGLLAREASASGRAAESRADLAVPWESSE